MRIRYIPCQDFFFLYLPIDHWIHSPWLTWQAVYFPVSRRGYCNAVMYCTEKNYIKMDKPLPVQEDQI